MGSKQDGLEIGDDGVARCFWCRGFEDYRDYHDKEWGRPVLDDSVLFEKICLESMQSGLSWLTILRKRENFRAAFAKFDCHAISYFTAEDVSRLLLNTGIVRSRAKIESIINNAKRACDLIDEKGSFAVYVWSFAPSLSMRAHRCDARTLTQSPASVALSIDLKKRGWSFLGPTTCYAFMQAAGLVNDHLDGCIVCNEVENQRSLFVRPC